MAFETINVETEDHVCLIRLNRPDALNALNTQLLGELCQALEEADSNDKVRCIVLTGSDKAFAAGADIKEMSEKSFVEVFDENLFADASDRIMRVRKPIIAAVAGYALGGGCELAMACDFIIAADTAKFGQPEINLGVIAGMGCTPRLTRYVG
ncbi:MAG: enoyl-CoA hydratase-related protein, partial [Arenibacterium sp.]